MIRSCQPASRHLSWVDAFRATDRISPALLDAAGLDRLRGVAGAHHLERAGVVGAPPPSSPQSGWPLSRPQLVKESEMPRWIFVLAFALVFYGNGAAFVESFVNYPSWHLIGNDAFLNYHKFIGPRVIAFLVVPAVLGTVLTIVLLRSRPAAIPLWSVWVAILLQLVVWVSTATIQIPIQLQLAVQGASPALLERLIETNWWLRRVPYAVCAALFLWMATRAIAPHERDA